MLFSDGDTPSILLIKRAETLSKHRGEWALPGGSAESRDRSLLDTALRETEEEVGIQRRDIEIWGPLDAVVTGTGYIVWPFGGKVSSDIRLRLQAAEVADAIHLPLEIITEQQNHRTITRLDSGHGREFGAFAYGGRIIWGATARMLFQVSETVHRAQSIDIETLDQKDRDRVVGGNGD